MNYHLYPVNFKKYSLLLLYAFLLMAMTEWGMELYFEKLYGDLTRTGYFSERDFGWRALQPPVYLEQLKNYSLTDADILVIGDSFSEPRLWQSKLIADGLKVCTVHWRVLQTADILPDDLGIALRAAGFKGHYVIIESVERGFEARTKKLSQIGDKIIQQDAYVTQKQGLMYPYPQRERINISKLNGADWGVKTLYNKLKLSLDLPDKILKSKSVRAIQFDGCQFFSHKLCHYGLFFDGDFIKETFSSIDNVRMVNNNLQDSGIQPIWLIIPDKATVYLGYGAYNEHPYQNIWQSFAQYPELIAPDLGTVFVQKSHTVKDFYMNNDTHLSTSGFLYLGDIMADEMRKITAGQMESVAQ
jgi:hypothetical protein